MTGGPLLHRCAGAQIRRVAPLIAARSQRAHRAERVVRSAQPHTPRRELQQHCRPERALALRLSHITPPSIERSKRNGVARAARTAQETR